MLQVRAAATESIADLLEFCERAYQFAGKDRYVVASVADNEIVRIHPQEEQWRHMQENTESLVGLNLSHVKLFIFEKPKDGDEVGKKLVFLNFAFAKKFPKGDTKRVSLPPRLIWVSEDEDIHQQVENHIWTISDDTHDDASSPYTLEFFNG